jgi:purine-binding chemotaxis protein CheW
MSTNMLFDDAATILSISNFLPRRAFGAKIRADFIQRMGKVGGKFVIIRDIQKVLSVDEIASLATMAERSEEGGAAE